MFMLHSCSYLLSSRDLWSLRRRWVPLISRYCLIGLDILNLNVRLNGEFGQPSSRGRLLVSNHLSYLDILIVASQNPAAFVTSQEIKETPLLGWVCTLAGCVFVERRNKQNLRQEISEITRALELGIDVVVFPEATSTNGDSVLRFKRPLFEAARACGAQVIPFSINYRSANGELITRKNRDHFCWYGNMTFVPHLWSLTKYKQINVSLDIAQPIVASNFVDIGGLAELAHREVEARFAPFQPTQHNHNSILTLT